MEQGAGEGTYQNQQTKLQLCQRLHEIHHPDRLRERRDAAPDKQVRKNQQHQYHERANPHRPREAHLLHEPGHHDRKNHTAQTRARRGNAKAQRPLLEKPRRHAVEGRVEHHARSECGAESLREKELVVLRADTGHHEAEDVQEGADEHDVAGAVVVVEAADPAAAHEHERRLQRGDPGDCAGGIRGELVRLVVVLEDADAVDPA